MVGAADVGCFEGVVGMLNVPPHIADWALNRHQRTLELENTLGRFRRDPLIQNKVYRRQRELRAEPVSAAIGLTSLLSGGFAAAGLGYVAAFTAASALGGAIVTAGVLAGANYAFGAISKSALAKAQANNGGVGFSGPSSINTPEARGTIRQAAAAQRIIYGRMGGVGGVWSFYDDATPPYQYVQLMICRGRISAVRSVMINNNRIVFSGGNVFNSIRTPLGVEGQDYVGNLRACFRQGAVNQTKDALLEAEFPASGSDVTFDEAGNVTSLPASFRHRGIATATFEANFGTTREQFEERWGQVAFINPLLEVDGKPIFDPRDPSQDAEDEDSWKFTYNGRDVGRNPALITRDWLCADYGGRLRPDQIRIDELLENADYDDEVVHDVDGNPRVRHHADGLIQLNENPRHVTEALMTANRSMIVNSRGRVGWVSARPKEPVMTLTERDFLGGFDYQFGARKRESFNRVRTRFTSPGKDYVEDDGPIHDREDLREGEDADELFDTTVRVPFTTDQRCVQWLSQQFLEESRLPKSLEISQVAINPKTLRRKIGDVIRVQHKRYPQINGIYQIRKDGWNADFSILSWSLRQYDRTISERPRGVDEIPYDVAQAA